MVCSLQFSNHSTVTKLYILVRRGHHSETANWSWYPSQRELTLDRKGHAQYIQRVS